MDGGAGARRPATLRGRPPASDLVAIHALGWLVAGCAVGLLLATLLLVPTLGDWIAPFGYGRWMPLHLDLLLYGWLAVPLLGLLLRLYLPAGGGWRAELALALWSGALLASSASWLAGRTGGKPFLEWTGGARMVWVGSLALLVVLLAEGWRTAPRTGRGRLPLALLLVALAAVPLGFWKVTSRAHYPPVDPASGGPTGGSLLASSLALLALLVAVPYLLRLESASPGRSRRSARVAAGALLATAALWLALPEGDRGNEELAQQVALFALLPWLVLLPRHALAFAWPAEARRWLLAVAGWGLALLPTAVLTFLPPLLRAWKFTNALVAHAHLAMAGLCSAFAALLLVVLAEGSTLRRALAAPLPFWAWQGGCATMVVVLYLLGTAEGRDPGLLLRAGSAGVTAAYAARWVAGLAMLGAAIAWHRGAVRSTAEAA